MSEGPLLQVAGLTLTVPSPRGPVAVVDRVGFVIGRGETLGLLGESGCGKTLTALSLLRLLPPAVHLAAGSVRFDGVDLAALPERQLRRYRGKRVAMVFQDPAAALNPVLRVGAQVEEVLEVHRRLSGAQRRREVARLFGDVGLAEPERSARRYPHELSGGQRQRVLIAMALAGEPELVVADEPTASLDVTVQAQILELFRELRQRRGLSLLWIGHDLGVAASLCDRVTILYAGRVAETGALARVFRQPLHPYTQGLLAAMPLLERRAPPKGIPGRVPPPAELPEGCRFRDRCPAAFADCASEPALIPAPLGSPGQAAACWLHATRPGAAT